MSNVIQMQGGGSPFDSIKQVRKDGSEFWSARDLMPLLGYGTKWQNFAATIDRAKIAAEVQGHDVNSLFTGVSKVSGTRGPAQQDYEMARFAAYLTAMNGDPRKPEIAAAMAYFAVRTHEAETAAPAIPQTYSEALRAAADNADRAEKEAARAQAAELEAAKSERRLEAAAPKIAKSDAHSGVTEWKRRQDFAREVQQWGDLQGVDIKQTAVHRLLSRKGMTIAPGRSDSGQLTRKAVKSRWGKNKKGTAENGHAYVTPQISPSGQDMAWKWIVKALDEYGAALNPAEEASA